MFIIFDGHSLVIMMIHQLMQLIVVAGMQDHIFVCVVTPSIWKTITFDPSLCCRRSQALHHALVYLCSEIMVDHDIMDQLLLQKFSHRTIPLSILQVYMYCLSSVTDSRPLVARHEAIMLQKLSIMPLSSAPKITFYAFEKCPLFPKLCH